MNTSIDRIELSQGDEKRFKLTLTMSDGTNKVYETDDEAFAFETAFGHLPVIEVEDQP
jgi:hypothetical protein